METERIAELIEEELEDATVRVTVPQIHGDNKHYAIDVVSPDFEGLSLIDQHQLVHDALDEHLTRDIHAIELTTAAPDE